MIALSKYEKENVFFHFVVILFLLLICVASFNSFVYVGNENISSVIVSPLDENGYVFVRPMETTNEILDIKLIHVEENATLNQSLSENDRVAYFNTGHGIVAQDSINFYCDNRIVQINAELVNGNNITLAMPSDINCGINDLIQYGRSNANIVGNITTPTEFCFMAYWNKTYHINRMLGTIRDESPMDDGLFGGIPKLTYPVVYRVYDGYIKNLFPVSRNGAFALRMYDVTYADKAPSGEYGFRFRRSFGGADKNGAVIELNGNTQDKFCKLVSVDLTDLIDFETLIQGHIGEN